MAHALVVDASVARSSGDETATHAHSIACRDALMAMRDVDCGVVISPDILQEWKKHQSRFARKWLTQMFARRRVVKVAPLAHGPTAKAVAGLRNSKDRAAAEKDLLLVDAAVVADSRVLSCDSTVRALFASVADGVTDLKDVHWATPAEDRCLPWLLAGAPDDATLLLAG